MAGPNLKLNVTFEFELEAPDDLLPGDHETLRRQLGEMLGAMVLQGMPTVTAKQLARSGIRIASHHHRLDVVNLAAAPVPREAMVAAAPHLTDDELDQLARRTMGKLPLAEAERVRFLRRQALALVSDFRMVACVVHARLTSGKDAALQGRLNLTNGSILIGERDRHNRLQAHQAPIRVDVDGTGVQLSAACAGHTLSGPVIEVALTELAAHRDPLIGAWQAPAA